MKRFIYTLIILLPAIFYACSDFLDPEQDGSMNEDEIFANAAYFTAPLMDTYSSLPSFYNVELDVMTDNAVDTDLIGDYHDSSVGGLRPDNNPLNNWSTGYKQIRQINIFLAKMVFDPTAKLPTPVRFYPFISENDSIDNTNEFFRLLGEAYFLRAYWQADLLKNFGGEAIDGTILGVPIVGDKILNMEDDLNLKRANYDDCVLSITNDCDSAIKYLPVEYSGNSRVTGAIMNGRASGASAMALKARVLLYAASPAFNKGQADVAEKWEKAAIAAGTAIKNISGLKNLSNINQYYFNQLNDGVLQNRDILFRSPIVKDNRFFENNYYPRGMYGKSGLGITQNFVDAFPDKDGYPIDEVTYDFSTNPYGNRDPRLNLYVAYNNTKLGPNNYYTLECHTGGKDAYLPHKETARTGYYLKKLTKYDQVRLIPGSLTGTQRAHIILGLPELYLNYAEAANEAWGVKTDPQAFGFTAYDVFRKIQIRYGCGVKYLDNEIGADVDKFRKYIHNERRIELSFEGHYFYDQRRLISDNKTEKLNKDIYGVSITKNNDGSFSYKKKWLEKKFFMSPYLPIPYVELFNSENLVQNYGWNF